MLLVTASLVFAQIASAEAAPPPPPCATQAHAAFDFWVGEWDVFPNGSVNQIATSRIERLHNGCAVREQWMPVSGEGGSSLNSLDAATGRWHQVWIGSGGETVRFEGGAVGGKMVLNGYWADINGPGMDGLVRMTYSAQDDGSVRQFGEVSTDHGLTWSPSFDLIYRPR